MSVDAVLVIAEQAGINIEIKLCMSIKTALNLEQGLTWLESLMPKTDGSIQDIPRDKFDQVYEVRCLGRAITELREMAEKGIKDLRFECHASSGQAFQQKENHNE